MDKIKKITSQKAKQIINTRKPLGKFYFNENDVYIGIDNSTGDVWTQVFFSYDEMATWQNDIEPIEEDEMEI